MGKVKYIHRIDDVAGIKTPRRDYYDVNDNFVKTYQDALAIILCLPDCASSLIQYLASKMSEENIVHHNKFTRENFNKYIYSIWLKHFKEQGEDDAHEMAQEKTYKDNTIKKSFATLTEKKLLIPKTRGMYIVNPEYFFKKGEEARYKKIKMTLEIQKGTSGLMLEIQGE